MPPAPLLLHSISIQCYEWDTSRYYMDSSLKNREKKNGGAMENRTPDLRVANATLYQLSYDPTKDALLYRPTCRASSAKGG